MLFQQFPCLLTTRSSRVYPAQEPLGLQSVSHRLLSQIRPATDCGLRRPILHAYVASEATHSPKRQGFGFQALHIYSALHKELFLWRKHIWRSSVFIHLLSSYPVIAQPGPLHGDFTQRNPRSDLMVSGPKALLTAQRNLSDADAFQLPPRTTRNSPLSGPTGFSFGLV